LLIDAANLTIDGDGFRTADATGSALPTASNLNFVAGQTVPNLVIAKVDANRQVSLFNGRGRAARTPHVGAVRAPRPLRLPRE
jgi:hypothetical protein